MKTAELYRRYADNCLKIAKVIHDEMISDSLLDMAQVWTKLAEQAEKDQPTKR